MDERAAELQSDTVADNDNDCEPNDNSGPDDDDDAPPGRSKILRLRYNDNGELLWRLRLGVSPALGRRSRLGPPVERLPPTLSVFAPVDCSCSVFRRVDAMSTTAAAASGSGSVLLWEMYLLVGNCRDLFILDSDESRLRRKRAMPLHCSDRRRRQLRADGHSVRIARDDDDSRSMCRLLSRNDDSGPDDYLPDFVVLSDDATAPRRCWL